MENIFRNTDVWKCRFVKDTERCTGCFERDRCMRSAFSPSSSPTVLLRSHHQWGMEKDEPVVWRAEQGCSVLGGNQAEEMLSQLSFEWGREKPRSRERRRDNLGCFVNLKVHSRPCSWCHQYEFQAFSSQRGSGKEARKAEVTFSLSLPKGQRERAVRCKEVRGAMAVTTHHWEKGSSLLVFWTTQRDLDGNKTYYLPCYNGF